jgi:long-chain acyl-CoA synthetase
MPPLPQTLPELFARDRCRSFLEREFLVFASERLTFSTVLDQAACLGAFLQRQLRVRKGDRVAIGMRNWPEYIVSYIAVTSVGAIAVLLNAWWTAKVASRLCASCGRLCCSSRRS